MSGSGRNPAGWQLLYSGSTRKSLEALGTWSGRELLTSSRSHCTQYGCGVLRTRPPMKSQYICPEFYVQHRESRRGRRAASWTGHLRTRGRPLPAPRVSFCSPVSYPRGNCTRAFYAGTTSSSSGPGLPPSQEDTMTAPRKTQVILSQLHCGQASPASSPRPGVPPASSGRSLSLGPIGVSPGKEGTR